MGCADRYRTDRYLLYENQTPRSDSANFVPLELISCPEILEPRPKEQSTTFPALAYSYGTCGEMISPWVTANAIRKIKGRTLRVGVPIFEVPWIYKSAYVLRLRSRYAVAAQIAPVTCIITKQEDVVISRSKRTFTLKLLLPPPP